MSAAIGVRSDNGDAIELRFGQVGIASVRVKREDAAALHAELERRVHAAPQLFERAAVVLDLSHLPKLPDDGAMDALLEAVRAAGMLPVGLAYGTSETDALARRLGLPLIAKFRAAYERESEPAPRAEAAPARASTPSSQPARAPETSGASPASTAAQHHSQPVRTGQQVYARGRDLVIVAPVANGAEVLADGNVHVYGPLRGRAFAGALGDENARIYCSEFRAELVSIAGHYRVFEEIPAQYEDQAVQIFLQDGKLRIEKL